MSTVIAGVAGFIGSHLCDRLLEEGHTVIGLDNLITGSPSNLAHLRNHPRFQFILHDVTTPVQLNGSVDIVLHLASPASPRDYRRWPIETLEVGSRGTLQLLDLARRQGARFLLASSSGCYGDPLEHPQKESYWGNVNPVGPRSCYDEAKRFAEALTLAYHRRYGLRTHIARIFNTYGPRMKLDDGRVVPTFLGQALNAQPLTIFGIGSQTRSFCYISDMVEGLYRLMLSDETHPVNLGNPHEITVRELAEIILQLTGSRSSVEFQPLPEDDPSRRQPDVSRARRALGWEPKVPLVDGLQPTVEYFREMVGCSVLSLVAATGNDPRSSRIRPRHGPSSGNASERDLLFPPMGGSAHQS